MTTKVTSEFLHSAIISDHTQVSAASTDHVLIHDASDNTLKKALVSTIASGATALDDIGTGDAASTLATSSGDIILDSPDSIVLDADGDGSVSFKDGGTRYALIEKSSDNLVIRADLSDGDILFQGKDNTTTITALTLDMSAEGGATFNGNITLGDNKGVYFGAGSDLIISSDGTNGAVAAANGGLTLDVVGDITFDADGGDILFKDDGLLTATLTRNVANFEITVNQSDGDFVVKGNDGGSTITPFRLDMSTGGRALFTSDLVALETAGQYLQVAGSSSNYWAIGSTGGNNAPGTASTTLAFHHWNGSAWNNEVEFDSSGNITADGTISAKLLNNTWINSAEGDGRIYYANSGETYFKADGSHLFRKGDDTTIANIDTSGNGTFAGNVTAYGSPSDIVLKENVSVIDNAMEKVNQLKGITYDLKSDGNRLTGLVAQDLEKVLPEAVYTAEDLDGKEHLAIRYGNTVGLLVEAIKELSAKIEKLEGK